MQLALQCNFHETFRNLLLLNQITYPYTYKSNRTCRLLKCNCTIHIESPFNACVKVATFYARDLKAESRKGYIKGLKELKRAKGAKRGLWYLKRGLKGLKYEAERLKREKKRAKKREKG